MPKRTVKSKRRPAGTGTAPDFWELRSAGRVGVAHGMQAHVATWLIAASRQFQREFNRPISSKATNTERDAWKARREYYRHCLSCVASLLDALTGSLSQEDVAEALLSVAVAQQESGTSVPPMAEVVRDGYLTPAPGDR